MIRPKMKTVAALPGGTAAAVKHSSEPKAPSRVPSKKTRRLPHSSPSEPLAISATARPSEVELRIQDCCAASAPSSRLNVGVLESGAVNKTKASNVPTAGTARPGVCPGFVLA